MGWPRAWGSWKRPCAKHRGEREAVDSRTGAARRPRSAGAPAAPATRAAGAGSDRWSGRARRGHTPGARSARTWPGSPAPRSAAPRASGLFSDELLQGLVIQGEVRDQTLEPAILVLERAQPPGLVHLEPGVLGLPTVKRLLADGVAPAKIGALRPGLGLLQDPDDLLLGEPFPSSRGLPAGILADETLTARGAV